MATELALTVNGRAATVEVMAEDGELRVRLDDPGQPGQAPWRTAQIERTNQSGLYSLLIGGRSYELFVRERPGGFQLLIGNRVYEVDVGRRRGEEAAPAVAGTWTLLSPMSGIISEVRVANGDAVQAGQAVIVVESMKMNNELTAARGGTVSDVQVSPGQRVEKGQTLLQIG